MKPVIDVHAHVFRGRDIPLKGFLLARRYPEWYITVFGPVLFSIIARCIRKGGSKDKGLLCGRVLNLVYRYMDDGYRRTADILSEDKLADIAAKLVETFDKDEIELYVPLMIDYEYWFRSTPEPSIADQIDDTFRDIVLPYKGRIHPFVSFDPARELAHRKGLPSPDDPEGGPPEKYSSLDLVKDAIRNRGFIGVKVYNTLGYRPFSNPTVDEKRDEIFRRNRRKRYEVFTGQELDEVLSDLYRYCVSEQVPITAHCTSNGVEAYFGASFDFGRPEYWREVLDKFPDMHLNLAHFGWDHPEGYFPAPPSMLRQAVRRMRQSVADRSFRSLSGPSPWDGEKTWVREICEMADEYRYLYTDVSHHGVTVDDNIQKFKTAYQGICRDFSGVIQKKLLFGIDWHVITREDNFESFRDRYVRVLGEDNIFTSHEIEDFLGGNALHFLGLLPLGTPPEVGWTRNRTRLQRFYESNHIDPPGWFTSTA
jgi:predicted TIM-barrel fold metal-dependent hydrolase